MSESTSECKDRWLRKIRPTLIGLKITHVRYLSDKEVENLGWNSSGVVIRFDNGMSMWPSADDEGNDAGALFTTDEELDVIPVI
jgi:hypothetical protein